MPRLGLLSVKLLAENKEFDKRIKGSQGVLSDLTGSIGVGTRTLVGLSAGFIGFRGLTGFVDGLKESFVAMDRLAKGSETFGLSIKQLRGLQEAAALSGVESGKLNSALRSMVKNVGEAAVGTGGAIDAIQGLGLSARRLSTQGTFETFLDIADAANNLGNVYKRNTILSKIFETENVVLAQTFKLGREEIVRITDSVEKAGAAFSRDLANPISEVVDLVTKLRTQLEGLRNDFARDLAPSISDALRLLVRGVEAIRSFRSGPTGPAVVAGMMRGAAEISSFGGILPTDTARIFREGAADFQRESERRLSLPAGSTLQDPSIKQLEVQEEMLGELRRLNTGAR